MRTAILAAVATLALAGAARAEVTDSSAQGFQSRHLVTIDAPPDRVYQALTQEIGRWWNDAHSWSGKAANLSIDLKGGCFCETLPKGFARHATVVYADGATLRLAGALGPLTLTGATGHLSFSTKAVNDKTELTVTYDVGGYARDGLAATWAGPVDTVIGEQVGRLKAYVEAGKAK
jgi:hypothetical protein